MLDAFDIGIRGERDADAIKCTDTNATAIVAAAGEQEKERDACVPPVASWNVYVAVVADVGSRFLAFINIIECFFIFISARNPYPARTPECTLPPACAAWPAAPYLPFVYVSHLQWHGHPRAMGALPPTWTWHQRRRATRVAVAPPLDGVAGAWGRCVWSAHFACGCEYGNERGARGRGFQ